MKITALKQWHSLKKLRTAPNFGQRNVMLKSPVDDHVSDRLTF
jgi:hypothetical protein